MRDTEFRENATAIAVLLVLGLCVSAVFGLGWAVGLTTGKRQECERWESLLVDDPEGVSSIRSAVTFERAAVEARAKKD